MTKSQIQPSPGQSRYNELIKNISKGAIVIPEFQREFVWDRQESAELIDSILKGYPIGTFIFWGTDEKLQGIRSIGNVDISNYQDEKYVKYVLDGQQRLYSLFAITEGVSIEKNGEKVNYKDVFIDLEKSLDAHTVVVIEKPSSPHISVYDLLHKDLWEMVQEYGEHIKQISEYQNALKNYAFSTILIDDYPLEKTVDIFNRINTAGSTLRLFDIMVAKTWEERSFNLRHRHKKLQDQLADVSYEIPEAQFLQCISININKECKRKNILELKKSDITEELGSTISAIKKTVDHFRISYGIPSGRILSYPALIVPFSYFFHNNKGSPTQEQDMYLKEYFWRASLTSRFTSSVESKLATDCKFMDEIMEEKRPKYGNEFNVSLKESDIQNLKFGKGAINSAILCVLTSLRPKSFKTGNEVDLSNTSLVKSRNRSYHHFFPKGFLKKQGINPDRINLTANITLIDVDLNKEIGSRGPSEYMKIFSKENNRLEEDMKTHLIDNMEEYGIHNDNYEKFIEMRSRRIWEELRERFEPE